MEFAAIVERNPHCPRVRNRKIFRFPAPSGPVDAPPESGSILAHLLLLQLKRIGDAVLTAPVLGALRQAMPDATLTLILSGPAGNLAPLFQKADQVLLWNEETWAGAVQFWERFAALRPDAVLDFTGSDRSALLAVTSGASIRAGYAKASSGRARSLAINLPCHAAVRDLHTIDFHHALPQAAGLPTVPVPDAGHLLLPSGDGNPSLPAGYVVIHPGTAREEKFWPAESWRALLQYLHQQYQCPLVLTGGTWAPEVQHIDTILDQLEVPVLNLSGRLSLVELARVIAGARLAITVDTGAMHLAASFEVPQISLFGPTNPFHWAPRHPLSRVLQAGVLPEQILHPKQGGSPMIRLEWDQVARAADSLLQSPVTRG